MDQLKVIFDGMDQRASDILAAAQGRSLSQEEIDFLHQLRSIAYRESLIRQRKIA